MFYFSHYYFYCYCPIVGILFSFFSSFAYATCVDVENKNIPPIERSVCFEQLISMESEIQNQTIFTISKGKTGIIFFLNCIRLICVSFVSHDLKIILFRCGSVININMKFDNVNYYNIF